MINISPPAYTTDYKQYAIWLIASAIAVIGFRYAKEIVSFVLDKLYQFFIQNHPTAI